MNSLVLILRVFVCFQPAPVLPPGGCMSMWVMAPLFDNFLSLLLLFFFLLLPFGYKFESETTSRCPQNGHPLQFVARVFTRYTLQILTKRLRATSGATTINHLTPNDPYMGRTAPLTSKRCILYIYSTNIGTEYFKHALYSPFFYSLQNAVCFIMLTCLVPVLFTFYIQGVLKLKKKIIILIPAPNG